MSDEYTFNVTRPGDGYCPVSGTVYQNFSDYLNGNVTVSKVAGTGTTPTVYVTGTTPTPSAGAIWYRLNSDSFHPFPIAVYGVLSGRWVPFTNNQLGDVMWTFRDPTNQIDANGFGLFVPSANDTTPTIAGSFFGWQLANGKNGSTNLWNRFPLAANKFDDPAAPGIWSSQIQMLDGNFSQSASGGRTGTIPQNAIPPLNAVEYDAAGNASTAQLYGGTHYTATSVGTINPTTGAQQNYAPIYPLYRSVSAFEWVGYGAVAS